MPWVFTLLKWSQMFIFHKKYLQFKALFWRQMIASMFCNCYDYITLNNVCTVHRGISVHWGDIMSTVRGYHEYTGGCSVHQGNHEYSGGYHEYTRGCSVHRGITWVHQGLTTMSVGDIMSTVGDVQYTRGYHEYTGVYHGECGGYHEYSGGCSVHWGIIKSTLGDTKMHVEVIISTPEGVQYTGGIPWVHRGCSVHWRDTMSIPGDFDTNEKSHHQNSRIFVPAPFATMQMYMLAFGTSDSLLKFLHQVARA